MGLGSYGIMCYLTSSWKWHQRKLFSVADVQTFYCSTTLFIRTIFILNTYFFDLRRKTLLTLSESRSGSAWQSRYRNDFGSRQRVCRVVRKCVPPTFKRTHFDVPLKDVGGLPLGEDRTGHLLQSCPLISQLFSAIPLPCLLFDEWGAGRKRPMRAFRSADKQRCEKTGSVFCIYFTWEKTDTMEPAQNFTFGLYL